MSAGAAPLARADAYAQPRRSRSALALAIGLHLLAAWFWLQQRPVRLPRPPGTPGMVTILLRPIDAARTPAPASPSPTRPPHATSAASPTADTLPSVQQRDLPPVFVPPPVPIPASASGAAPAAPAASTPSTAPAAPAGTQASTAEALGTPGAGENTSPATPATADGGLAASLGRRQAGRIDRDLRGGKPGVPTEADTPWARFQRGLEAAHVDRSMSAHLDSYTSPDGVVIYRRRVGGRIACYRTGSVAGGVDSSLGVLGTRGSGDAGSIPCPSSAQWKQEE